MKNCVKIAQGGETIAVNLKLSPSPRASCRDLEPGFSEIQLEMQAAVESEKPVIISASGAASFTMRMSASAASVCVESIKSIARRYVWAAMTSGGPHGVWAMQPSWPRARMLRDPEMQLIYFVT